MAYKEAFNGNTSAVHWDLVSIQRPDYGGGEIYFDDVLVRKDGLFVIDSLKGLNLGKFKINKKSRAIKCSRFFVYFINFLTKLGSAKAAF